MPRNDNQEKNCTDYNQRITFEDFCRDNPSISLKRAHEFWKDSFFLIYCSDCYFNHPERPYKVKNGYFNYYRRTHRNFK